MPLYFVDLAFTAQTCVKSLPPRHGARWSAFVRNICHAAELAAEHFFSGLVPLQQGQTPVKPGTIHLVRMLLTQEGVTFLPAFSKACPHTPVQGDFSSASFVFSGIIDPFRAIWLEQYDVILPFDTNLLKAEIELLQQCHHWSLSFDVPLRLPKPPCAREKSCSERERFCDPDFFATRSPDTLSYLLSKLRFIHTVAPCPQTGPSLMESQLIWEDMRYNARRCIALGGVVGNLRFVGAPNTEMATLLVLGQYVGLGKNPRFGLGYYRIPELDRVRCVTMPGKK